MIESETNQFNVNLLQTQLAIFVHCKLFPEFLFQQFARDKVNAE